MVMFQSSHIVFILWMFILSLCFSECDSSSYNVYNYDMTTPMFTPDGRLKQVEYASLASSHSSPMIVHLCSSTITTNTDDSESPNNDDGEDDDVLVIMATMNSKTNDERPLHRRMVPLRTGSSCSNGGGIVLGMSGVLADNVSLWNKARKFLQMQHYQFGPNINILAEESNDNISTGSAHLVAKRLAQELALKCQEHAFGGGLRPYGVTLAIVSTNHNGHVHIQTVDPSGAIHSPSLQPHSSSPSFVILGGNSQTNRQLQSHLKEQQRHKENNISFSKQIKHILQSLIDVQNQKLQESKSNDSSNYSFEVICVTKKGRTYRLSSNDIQKILKRNDDNNKAEIDRTVN